MINFKQKIFILLLTITSIVFPQDLIINEIMSSNLTGTTDEYGNYEDWIELYNAGDSELNLLNYSLSDDVNQSQKWRFPDYILEAKNYVLVFASGKNTFVENLHANFKIKSAGEKLFLTSPNGNIIDSVDSISIPPNHSYGRNKDSLDSWQIFNSPTPGSENSDDSYGGVSTIPIFSHGAGFYTGKINLILSSSDENSIIYYTLDGSTPTQNSNLFTNSISIDTTTTVKAICYATNLLPSLVETQTIFINENSFLPIISLSTNPSNLWDDEIGIYVDGTNGTWGQCNDEKKNYFQDWERPVTIEFFETDKLLAFKMNAGMKIFGGCTRNYPQKSLAIYARRKYGNSSFNYPIFPELPFTEYESLVLRNSGNDYYSALMRDGLMHNLVRNLDLETQAYRPAIVFINGAYWGIHNIREKINENYLAQHHDIDPDNLDILESNKRVIEGDTLHYANMLNFIKNNDLSNESNYEYVKSLMDTDNFISYCVSQIYFDNTDWPAGNIKYWRSKDGGKWRWILFDTDYAFGLYDSENYKKNTLAFVLDENGTNRANPPWATFLLRKLLNNTSFKEKFINTFADFSNTIFHPNIVNNKIDILSDRIKPEIKRHISKWGEQYPDSYLYLYWQSNISKLHEFASERLPHLRTFYTNQFNLKGISNISISKNISESGKLNINSITINDFPWNGNYFSGNPIELEAVPRTGYRFTGWSLNDSIISNSKNLTIDPISDMDLIPLFEPDSSALNKIIMNEINYNSAENFDCGDWIEIVNVSDSSLNLSGWKFRDSNVENRFVIPSNTIIETNDYLVIVEDTLLFKEFHPEVKNFIGNLEFKLSNEGEKIILMDNNEFIIDSLTYGIVEPWPNLSNFTGSTIELSKPENDNSDGLNWYSSSIIGGTPGKSNSDQNPTDVDNNRRNSIVDDFSLSQNYPNPFNPTTTIEYSVPTNFKGDVNITVFDVLGRELIVLVNNSNDKGINRVNFDAKLLSSGVYYYILKAGDFIHTRKMILMK